MSGAVVVITYDGTDITDKVLFRTATFESLMNAQPGTCEFTVLDADQTFAPVTGKEITLSVDGQLLWGGYLMMYSETHPFAADLVPVDPADYAKRQWILRGSDYNILFDKRVVRNPDDYFRNLPLIPGTTMDGDAIKLLMNDYIDVPAGFDVETYVDNTIEVSANTDSEADYSLADQGSKLRDAFDRFTLRLGNVYYFDAAKNLHWHPLETLESRWGFSDQPNYTPDRKSVV